VLDTITYSNAVSSCEKGMLPELALELFKDMQRQDAETTVVTYSALISICEKGL